LLIILRKILSNEVTSIMRMRLWFPITLALAATAAGAETLYVTDTLQLGIHRARDTSDRPFENLVSGTALEVLERVPNYALVRTPDDQQGWVKSAFLVAEKPAKARLAELEAELEAVRAALRERETALLSAEESALRLSREMEARGSSADAIQDTLGRLKAENDAYEIQLDRYRGSLPLTWVITALTLTLIAGFAAGWWALDYMIRRRHGGFRIY
jgi:SH3 domain protein